MSKTERIELGAEHDERLFEALKQVLNDLKAVGLDSSWGVGGSQELSEWVVKIGNEMLEIEAETYIGLSISGSTELVRKVANLVQQKTSKK